MCVQIHTVCELTHCVQNYTVVPFAYNMKKFPSLEFFTLTPWLAWLTNMRYARTPGIPRFAKTTIYIFLLVTLHMTNWELKLIATKCFIWFEHCLADPTFPLLAPVRNVFKIGDLIRQKVTNSPIRTIKITRIAKGHSWKNLPSIFLNAKFILRC